MGEWQSTAIRCRPASASRCGLAGEGSATDSRRRLLARAAAEHLVHRGIGRALHVTSRAFFRAQVAIGPDHTALADGVAGYTAHGAPLEDVEVHLLVVGLRGDRAGAL